LRLMMRVPENINQQAIDIPKLSSTLIIIGKLGLWLSLTAVIFYFLFSNIIGQLSAIFSATARGFNLIILPWMVLVVCLVALWLARKPIWQAMKADTTDSETAIYGLVQRFLGWDLCLTSLLILLAYPLPPAPEFLIFRFLTAILAGFVLVFGRKAAFVPAIVIATYGVSLLSVSLASALVA
jgi:hypothetical protein